MAIATIQHLKAADTTEGAAILTASGLQGVFFWTNADFSGQADDVDIIKSDNASLASGAWVRQTANTIAFQSPATSSRRRTSQSKQNERRSLFDFIDPTYHGSIIDGTSGVDLTNQVQAALNDAASTGYGLYHPGGQITIGDVVLPAGVTLDSSAAGVAFTFSHLGARFKSKQGAAWIMAVPDGGGGCGISGINFVGLGNGSGGGLKVGSTYWGAYGCMTFDNFGEQAILAGGINADFSRILIINSLMTRSRSGYAGALEVSGTDNNFYNCEVTTSQARGDPDSVEGRAHNDGAIVNSGLSCSAIYVRPGASHNFFCNTVAELAEVGFRSGEETTQVVNLRCDLNLGHGGVGPIVGSSIKALNNSQGAHGSYSGWFYEPGQTAGMAGPFVAISNTAKRHRYGLDLSQGGGSGVDQRADWHVRSSGHVSAAVANFYYPNTIRTPAVMLRDHIIGATPDVDQVGVIVPVNSASQAVTVSNFLHGYTHQRVGIYGNANVTIANGPGIMTNTGSSKQLTPGKVYWFTLIEVPGGAIWVEDA